MELQLGNVPLGKTWYQVKQVLAKFVPGNCVLGVQVVPAAAAGPNMGAVCQLAFITLRQDTPRCAELMLHLNNYVWDGHPLWAFFLSPRAPAAPTAMPVWYGMPPPPPAMSIANGPVSAMQPQHMSSMQQLPGATVYGTAHDVHGRRTRRDFPFLKYNAAVLLDQRDRYQDHHTRDAQHVSMQNSSRTAHVSANGAEGKTNGLVSAPGQPHSTSKRLKHIFNEKTFRKQMTSRDMYQLKLTNFPPCYLLETLTPTENDPDAPTIKQLEKYGRVRWTILKDYIKLRCPQVMALQGESDNTRSFYVGVYEAKESRTKVNVLDEQTDDDSISTFEIDTVEYNAIIGFHNKELYDECLKQLDNQEYANGYRLQASPLAEYKDPSPTVAIAENSPSNDTGLSTTNTKSPVRRDRSQTPVRTNFEGVRSVSMKKSESQ